jgi:hypothetical protein
MTSIKCLLVLISIIYVNSASINVCVPESSFTDKSFRNLIIMTDRLIQSCPTADGIGKTVRMAFHDCVSGCNGCIDMENPDNKGLDFPLRISASILGRFSLTKFFNKYYLSRADIYALMGFRAIYIASKYTDLTSPTCEFKIGRKDCTGPQDNKEIFSSALGNWQVISKFFETEFKFNTQEVVALMGAHSLGRTWPKDSGFNGFWESFNNKKFSNAFYKNLLDREGKFNYAPGRIGNSGKQQWVSGNEFVANQTHYRTMLNSDMSLVKHFDINDLGVPSCNYQTCKSNEEPAAWVKIYADSEAQFKADFSKVFQKMLEHGYEGTNTLIDIVPNASNKIVQNDIEKETIKTILKSYENSTTKELFQVFHLLFKKKYELGTPEAEKRFNIFQQNLKIIKQLNEQEEESKRGINFYTDMSFEEYFKNKFRLDAVHADEILDPEYDKLSHLLEYA